MLTDEPTGQLTQITDAVTPGNYLLYEQLTGSSFSAEIFGEAFTHLGPAGFQIREVLDPTSLSLEVDTVTGQIAIKGDDTAPLDFNYYQVTSAAESLDVARWISLADQDFDGNGPANGSGNGWEEGGSSGAQGLAEGYLLGDSTVTAGSAIDMGTAYDTGVDARDLVFRYRSASGQSFFGDVVYVQTMLGDVDADGDVDDADLGTAFANYTGPLIAGTGTETFADGDNDGDGDVDDADLGYAFANYTGLLANANVPEPASALLIGLVGVAMGVRRRR